MAGIGSLGDRFDRLRQREDFAAHPVKAIAKRLYYRIRSRVSQRPWTLTLDGDIVVSSPIISTPGTAIFYLGASEPKTLRLFKALLRPGMVVADVGAHIGEYALVASRAVGERGRVFAFEPGDGVYPFLVENIALNRAANVTPFRMAVGDRDGEVSFNLGVDPGHSRLIIQDHGAQGLESRGVVTVPVTSLDSIETSENTAIDLVKIDVEGAEIDVFKGMTSMLQRQGSDAPVLLFEYLPRTWEAYGHRFEDGDELLSRYGYVLYGHGEGEQLTMLDEKVRSAMEQSELDLMILAIKPAHAQQGGVAASLLTGAGVDAEP